MADGFKIEVKGIKELQGALGQLATELPLIVSQAVIEGAGVVENSAKQKVRVRTGNLRDSIKQKNKTQSPTKVSVDIGTDVSYGPANEFGTSRMSAQPFLRPALDENEDAIEAVIERAINSALTRFR